LRDRKVAGQGTQLMNKIKNQTNAWMHPEAEFILAASSIDPGSHKIQRMKQLAKPDLDWPLFWKLALDHRVLPIVYKSIKDLNLPHVPLFLWDDLKSLLLKNTVKNLQLLSFQCALSDLFQKNNIPMIPLKGLMTAQYIYGDISLRVFSDIDLLIRKKDALKAYHLLEKNGFVPELKLDHKQLIKYLDDEDNLAFHNKKTGVLLELHWELSGLYLDHPIYFETLEHRLVSLTIKKHRFSHLSSEDLLIYLCIHGLKHGWDHLEHVLSVSELIQKKHLDWKLIVQLSENWKCRKLLYLGLYLASTLFEVPLPTFIANQIKKNTTILRSGSLIIKKLISSEPKSSEIPMRFSNIHFLMKDSPKGKLNHIIKLLFRPTKKDWSHFPVKGSLSWILYFLRPIRLFIYKLVLKHA